MSSIWELELQTWITTLLSGQSGLGVLVGVVVVVGVGVGVGTPPQLLPL